MLNIIPTEEKKKILTEYRIRLSIVSILAVVALILASLVLLAPSYLLTVSKYNSTSAQLAYQASQQGPSGQQKEVDTQVRAVNKNISLFLGTGAQDRLSPPDVIEKIIGIKSSDIKLEEFSYDVNGGQERIVINGTAANRDELAAFVQALKKDQAYNSVELPVSSYVKSTNIDFGIVLTRGVVAPPTKK